MQFIKALITLIYNLVTIAAAIGLAWVAVVILITEVFGNR